MNTSRSNTVLPRLLRSRFARNSLSAASCAVLGSFMLLVQPASAAVEYVKVCSLYGAGFYYVPGTDQCGNASGDPFREQTTYGTITNTPGTNSTAYGLHSFAYGNQSLAIGNLAWAGGDPTSKSPGPLGGPSAINGMAPGSAFFNKNTTAIGENAQAGAAAKGEINATAVGEDAQANGRDASAFGQASDASGDYSTAYGALSSATASGATAIGMHAKASGKNALAMGHNASATKVGSIAMGTNASSTGNNAIAIGTNSIATGSVAVGNSSRASDGGAAVGDFASATGAKSTAIGYGAVATGANSIAIGAGSVASGANTVSFGSPGSPRQLTNIAAGTAPGDAVNTQQFNGGLSKTLNAAEAYTDQQFAVFNANDFQRKAFSGISAAVAMGGGGMPSAPGKTLFSMNTSLFENYTGVGASLSHRFDTDIPLSLDAAFSHAGGENVGRVGFAVEF
jgi:autotransporter adhesin